MTSPRDTVTLALTVYLRVSAQWRRLTRRTARGRRCRRWVAGFAGFLVGNHTVWALADDGKIPANPFLSAFDVQDSHGIGIAQYEMSLTPGGTDIGQATAKFLLECGWDFYRLIVAIAVWIFDFSLTFKLVEVLTPVAVVANHVLNTSLGRIGLVGVVTIVGFIGALRAFNAGRSGAGIAEIGMVILLGWAVTSPLANPTSLLVGTDGKGGAVRTAADLGVAVAADIITGGNRSDDPADRVNHRPAVGDPTTDSTSVDDSTRAMLQAKTSGALVDVFVRLPHQVINYGAIIDHDSACAPIYDQAIQGGPYRDDQTPRTKMEACNKDYGTAAERPGRGLVGLVLVSIGSVFFLGLAVLLGIGLTLASISLLFEAASAGMNLLRAIVPGAARTALMGSIGKVGVALATITILLIGVGAFAFALRTLFDIGWNPWVVFAVIDLLILCASIYVSVGLLKARRAGQRWGQRAARAISPSAKSVASGGRPSTMAIGAAMVGQHVLARRAAGATGGVGPDRTPAGSAGDRLARAAHGAGTAATFALKSTIGAPVYAPRAYGVAKTALAAKRQQTTTRLNDARDRATAFGHEYAHNVAAPVKASGRAAVRAGQATGLNRPASALAAAATIRRSRPEPTQAAPVPRTAPRTPPPPAPPAPPRTAPTPAPPPPPPPKVAIGRPGAATNSPTTYHAPDTGTEDTHDAILARMQHRSDQLRQRVPDRTRP